MVQEKDAELEAKKEKEKKAVAHEKSLVDFTTVTEIITFKTKTDLTFFI